VIRALLSGAVTDYTSTDPSQGFLLDQHPMTSRFERGKRILKESVRPLLDAVTGGAHARYGWFGDYPSWDAARAQSDGYDAPLILERVKQATRSPSSTWRFAGPFSPVSYGSPPAAEGGCA
jgi:hypothetical protein